MRKLGIPTVKDRLVQQAMLQVMQRSFDASFSEHSYGFRPGRSAKQAVARAQEIIATGRSYVADLDLEKFFDRVNHDRLMAHLAKRIADRWVLRLIRAFLNAGVMENGLVEATYEGTPQGGPLSPLLSNVVLDELDRELERRGHQFVRYADDCNIYTASERAGQRVMSSISTFITKRLKLKVNAEKSAVGRPWERKFLGFRISASSPPLREIAPTAVARFKHQVRELTRRARGVGLERVIADLRPYIRGWGEYYGWCETAWMLVDLDRWVRRRLRCYVWTQWRTPQRRRARLRKLGVNPGLAALRLSASRPVAAQHLKSHEHCALQRQTRLPRSSSSMRLARLTRRTAVYGPVRTVVWEGRSRETPPYPDVCRACSIAGEVKVLAPT